MADNFEEKLSSRHGDPVTIGTIVESESYSRHAEGHWEVEIGDADEALQTLKIAGNNLDEINVEADTNRRLLRKIDLHVMPMMCLVYGLNFLDKTTLSYTSIMGLETDLNLSKNQYQWLGSIFYFGYLGFEYPTSRLMQRLPLAKYTAINVILWGITLSCTAATTNFAGIASVRFILGMLEASVTPAFVLFTSQWYTKDEQGTRTGIWFSFNGFAIVLGGLVAYGVAKGSVGQRVALSSWKILFLVWGVVTIVAGILFLIFMPDNPLQARFLNDSEKRLAIERIRINQQGKYPRYMVCLDQAQDNVLKAVTGVGNRKFKLYQFKARLLQIPC